MVRAAALALALSSAGTIQEPASIIPRNAEFAYITGQNSAYWVTADGLSIKNGPNGVEEVTIWMDGWHKFDPSVNYRSSVWRLVLRCNGKIQFNAGTTFAADGREMTNWDSLHGGKEEFIRPRSMYAQMEEKWCSKPK